MRILIVEDDYFQAEELKHILAEQFVASVIEIIATESAFRGRFEEIATTPPDVIVMDVMLRWADPSSNLPPPPLDVENEGYFRAGLRCRRLLAADERTRNIPVVLHTVLERADLGLEVPSDSHFLYARKEAESAHLIELINATFHARAVFSTRVSQDAGRRDQVFISYSHKDKRWLLKLRDMLKPLVRLNAITIWDDTCIRSGTRWREEISLALRSAKVAVLLVSPGFLASDFIAKYELPPLLQAASVDGLSVIWIAVSACLYREADIEKYQAANDPARPLDTLRPSEANRTLVRICEQVKEAMLSQ